MCFNPGRFLMFEFRKFLLYFSYFMASGLFTFALKSETKN